MATHFNNAVAIHDCICINKTAQITWRTHMQSRSELPLMQMNLCVLRNNTKHKNDSVIKNNTWLAKGTNQRNHNRTEILTCDAHEHIKTTHYHDVHIDNDAHFTHHVNDKVGSIPKSRSLLYLLRDGSVQPMHSNPSLVRKPPFFFNSFNHSEHLRQ